MKLATITRLAVCAAMLCLVGSYTVPVGALPTDEIERYFYSGCTSPVEIGYFDQRVRAVVTAEPLFDPAMERLRG